MKFLWEFLALSLQTSIYFLLKDAENLSLWLQIVETTFQKAKWELRKNTIYSLPVPDKWGKNKIPKLSIIFENFIRGRQ